MQNEDNNSGRTRALATVELARFIAELFASAAVPATATLADLRATLLGSDLFLTPDSEIMYRLDRVSLLIEVDELIDHRGGNTPLQSVLVP